MYWTHSVRFTAMAVGVWGLCLALPADAGAPTPGALEPHQARNQSFLFRAAPLPSRAHRHGVMHTVQYAHSVPIPVPIPIGQERRIDFGAPVYVQVVGAGLSRAAVRLMNNDGVLYVWAYRPFATTRVAITLIRQHRLFFMDISTCSTGALTQGAHTLKQTGQANSPPAHRVAQATEHNTDNTHTQKSKNGIRPSACAPAESAPMSVRYGPRRLTVRTG